MLARAERLHREIFRPGRSGQRMPAWEPPVDIMETDRDVLVLVALPGVDPDRVKRRSTERSGDRRGRVLPASCEQPSFTVSNCPRAGSSGASGCHPANMPRFGAQKSHGCLLITLEKVEGAVAEGEIMAHWSKPLPPKLVRRRRRASRSGCALPPDALIIVPVRNIVLFPGLVLPITIGRTRSIAAPSRPCGNSGRSAF